MGGTWRSVLRLHPELHPLVLPERTLVQVAQDRRPAPLPGTPEWLLGTVHFRGAFLPVFDLARRFCLAPARALRLVVVDPGEDGLVFACAELPESAWVDVPRAGGPSSAAPPELLVHSAGLFHTPAGTMLDFDPHAWLRRNSTSLRLR